MAYTGPHSASLIEWIDGTSIHRVQVDGRDSAEAGFLFGFYNQILNLFSTIAPLVSRITPPVPTQDIRSLKENVGSLFLWGDGFRDGSLDVVVENSADLKESITTSLTTMSRILLYTLVPMYLPFALPTEAIKIQKHAQEVESSMEKARSGTESDYDSDESTNSQVDHTRSDREKNSEAILLLGASVRCLSALTPSMEDTFRFISHSHFQQEAAALFNFQVSGPGRMHTAIRNLTPSAVTDQKTVSRSVFKPASMFHDSDLGSSIGPQTTYAVTVASHSSFMSSVADADRGGIRVPSTPKQILDGLPYHCEFCGHVLLKIKNRVDWKSQTLLVHFHKVQDELISFPTRNLWEEHEFNHHRIIHSWKCFNCADDGSPALDNFTSPGVLREHFLKYHGWSYTDSQFQSVADSAELRKQMPFEDQQCPFCLCIPGSSRRQFATHVGKHMEDIALAVLPREDDSDSEDEQKQKSRSSKEARAGILDDAACFQKLTTYAAYCIRKLPPKNTSDEATWARAEVIEEKWSLEDTMKEIKKLNESKRTVSDKKAALAQYQQGQINSLLDDLGTRERDPNFIWTLIQLSTKVRPVSNTGKPSRKGMDETVTMTLYVKRAPKEDVNPIQLYQALEKMKADRLSPKQPNVSSASLPPVEKPSGFDPIIAAIPEFCSKQEGKRGNRSAPRSYTEPSTPKWKRHYQASMPDERHGITADL
ncbi:hypothetical protein DL95DRAFT_465858 [Leptodontidium sp. 2 PMI_412]|nr:hypothetical protein DL95DRAFT_465858 [Leptodontidium sp. 2 PMI_412]